MKFSSLNFLNKIQKSASCFLILSVLIFAATGCSNKENSNELNIYTYDSWTSEWGPGPVLAQLFEEKTGIKINYFDSEGSAQLIAKAVSEKADPQGDIILGVDNNLLDQVKSSGVFEAYKPKGYENLVDGLEEELGGNWLLTPYDYSHFAIIFDTESGLTPPASLEDLTKPEYKSKLILMDSRISTVGIGFDEWVKAIYKDNADDYMNRLKPSVLTVAPGWSVGYGIFTKGEAPMVISYTTSPASHVEYEDTTRFQALVFEQGHVRQVEGLGLIKNAKNKENAKKFIDFLISEEAQAELPLTQWMFPASKTVKLPASYDYAPVPKTVK